MMSVGSQRTTLHGAASSRDSAPYSLSRRNCTTSNCSGPTAASSGVLMEELRRYKRLNHAFLQQLVEALAELFVFSRVRIVQIRERFRREARDFLVENFGIGRQRVADAKAVVADQADDVAGIRFIHRLALVAEQFVRTGQAHFFLGARMMHRHVALEFAGADADERDAVAVLAGPCSPES